MINILWPTVRPHVAAAMAKDWAKKADGDDFEIKFGVNDEAHFDILTGCDTGCAFDFKFSVHLELDARPGITHTATRMSVSASGEYAGIYILASDDFEAPKGWDTHLKEQFKDFDGALICNDGYKPGTNIIPIPIMGAGMMKSLRGIIYHPEYHHFFSDQELFDVVNELNPKNHCVRDLRATKASQFRHRHWSFSGGRKKDNFDLRNNGWWKEDEETYKRRLGLSVEEKLRIKRDVFPEYFYER